MSFGTGAPELAVTVHAAHAGSTELAIGNVVGSNIANVFLILGASALVTPLAVESRIVKADVPMILAVLGIGAMVAPDDIPVSADAVRLDIPIMIAAALARLPLFFTGCRPSRTGGGAVLLGYFMAYTAYVTMGATDASYTAMIGFVIPLTVLAVAFSVYQTIQSSRQKSSCRTEC